MPTFVYMADCDGCGECVDICPSDIMQIDPTHRRAVNIERYMGEGERHLDIGCGDGYFLRRSKCPERIGLDRLLCDDIDDHLDFLDHHFDYVTMLAVIEHIEEPRRLLAEIARVLSPAQARYAWYDPVSLLAAA